MPKMMRSAAAARRRVDALRSSGFRARVRPRVKLKLQIRNAVKNRKANGVLINGHSSQQRVILVTRLVVDLEDGLALDPREIRPAALPLEPQALL